MMTIRHVLLNTMGFYGKISLFISLEKHAIFLGFEVSSITLKIISILKNKERISILFDSKNLRLNINYHDWYNLWTLYVVIERGAFIVKIKK